MQLTEYMHVPSHDENGALQIKQSTVAKKFKSSGKNLAEKTKNLLSIYIQARAKTNYLCIYLSFLNSPSNYNQFSSRIHSLLAIVKNIFYMLNQLAIATLQNMPMAM